MEDSANFERLLAYLDNCRDLVVDQIKEIVPVDSRHTGDLYELMLDYPLRYGKALRPALSIAICRANGGPLSAVLPSAAVLELYHNAFLIHDDVEDLSVLRRSEHTLNRLYGAPTAVNVGDGMLALTFQPLLRNIDLVGLGKALRILRLIARMAQETAEGQMIELRWIRQARWDQDDSDYVRMVHKKTSWYSFIAPVIVGAITASMSVSQERILGQMVIPLGIAFQIQDDILNVVSEEANYGKDLNGDLWEGKRTIILLHALRSATRAERNKALSILSKSQPNAAHPAFARDIDSTLSPGEFPVFSQLIDSLAKQGELSEKGRRRLQDTVRRVTEGSRNAVKTAEEIEFLRDLIMRYSAVGYARDVAYRYALRFHRELERHLDGWARSTHKEFLLALGDFIVQREV